MVVPTVDFAPFFNGTEEERKKVAREMVGMMRDVGFMYVVNHGVPQEKIDKMFGWSRRFFALPEECKAKCPHPADPAHHRGWSHIGKEKVVQMVFDKNEIAKLRNKPDVKESFELGNDACCYSNVWPDPRDIPGFREYSTEFYFRVNETARLFLRAVSLGLDLGEEYLLDFHQTSDHQLRLLHYPPTDVKELETGEKERIAAHTDFGTMTLLFQDACGGLEVEDPYNKGVFIPAPYVPGAVVVNTGDFLQRWSNDTLKSTLHRVRAPPVAPETGLAAPRYSIPFFVGTDKTVVVDCLPTCCSESNPKKYEPISSKEYIAMRMRATY